MSKSVEMGVLAVAALGVFLAIKSYVSKSTKSNIEEVDTQYGAAWDSANQKVIYV